MLAGCLLFVAAALWAQSPVDRPNILLIMADDQGWGDVGYAGHPVLKTPHLDAMAASGLRFERFYAAAPVCSPTRGSVLTGRHPNRFGCFQWGHTLRPQEVTLPQRLKRAGYATGHFGKWHLGSVRQGSPVNPGESGFDRWLSAENYYDNDPILSREGRAVQLTGESSMIAADAAIQFMRESVQESRPFFAAVWFGSPHAPHRAAEKDRSLYTAQARKADFYGEVTGMDRAIGKLRQSLGDLGVRDNTLVWYCSDNGGLPGLGVTGGRGHKDSIYEGGLRVPAIIEWPARIRSPRITAAPANTVDIYPTLLEAIGARPAAQPPLDGVSLLPVIEGRSDTRPRPMGFWRYPAPGVPTPSDRWMAELLAAQQAGTPPLDGGRLRLDAGKITRQYPLDLFEGHAAWLDWPWKLHRIENLRQGSVRFELYNLADDPDERSDRAAERNDRVQAMRTAMEAWLKSVVRSLNGEDYSAPPTGDKP